MAADKKLPTYLSVYLSTTSSSFKVLQQDCVVRPSVVYGSLLLLLPISTFFIFPSKHISPILSMYWTSFLSIANCVATGTLLTPSEVQKQGQNNFFSSAKKERKE
jgi:hypothetical protein